MSAEELEAQVFLEGLRFGEDPRRGPDGALYLSDFYDHHVLRVDIATGEREVVCVVPQQPSGLGWLPDGRMLVVSMVDRAVLRLEPTGELVPHADLSDLATFHANDMFVDPAGRAYVGNFGFDLHGHIAEHGEASFFTGTAQIPTADLALVEPDGSVRVAAPGLLFPNGTVALPDGRMVIAETLAFRLTAFDVASDGTLVNPTIFADLRRAGVAPDGICLDAEGGIWVAAAVQPCAVRVEEGGRVTHRVNTSQNVFAVALIGTELVCCTAPTSEPVVVAVGRHGKLERAVVPYRGG
ncbi:SMP-30/gluconolactonase/LRE family protein [Allokutzneria sp. A3M-2-11 16]|uniref:SMP-30/gluconolactonase/LRE family protein n=1 Tax=Allokutzneria sp. A3M-2-11 16 TaxID=2962043 RepID=UPI0020B70181|nr:SMP-30/gluconolactonase/LRE family protein [Allokutzneria sp. A3M-2-11 16]MCP3805508.1 SMP-30/gluconolactonase/LRE family protein [Allokutzneria sp. A3M-2-11 16]